MDYCMGTGANVRNRLVWKGKSTEHKGAGRYGGTAG